VAHGVLVQHAHAVLGDGADAVLRVAGRTDLADNEDVERCTERMRDLVGDGHAAACQPEDHRILGRERRQLTDPVMAHQRAAPRLATCVGAQLLIQRRDLGVQCIDHRDSDRDLLARSVRDLDTLEPCSPLAGE
jgi:hypothetical protein